MLRRVPADRDRTPGTGPTATPALRREPSFAEWVCLTLITQKVSHGWALGTMLAPDGELGRIWTLSRPLTYRAIDGLVDKGLITRTRSGRRPRPRPGHPRRHRRPAGARQAVARHPRRAPARRPHRAARQAVPPRPGRPRQRADCSPPSSSCSPRPSTCSPRRAPTTTSSTCGAARAPAPSAASSTRPSTRPSRRAGDEAGVAPQRPQPAPRHRHRRAPRRGHVHRQGRARRRSTAHGGDHQGRRRRPRPRPRRRHRDLIIKSTEVIVGQADSALVDELDDRRRAAMQLSARNQLKATVDTVTHGEVMSTVRVTCPTVSTSPRRSPRTPPRSSASPSATTSSS